MKTGLLFDLDGTLVDSDPEHLVAFQRVFAPHGIELDHAEYAAKIMGASNEMIASRYLAHSKPDPLPYLTALERTDASAAHSVAFEDSLSGVRAAAAAGLSVVGITTTLDSRTLIEAGATFAASNFTDPRIFELIETRLNAGAEEGAKA
jgi:beta-phosphoglucomutase-like phosphatase (HAD superfamily)